MFFVVVVWEFEVHHMSSRTISRKSVIFGITDNLYYASCLFIIIYLFYNTCYVVKFIITAIKWLPAYFYIQDHSHHWTLQMSSINKHTWQHLKKFIYKFIIGLPVFVYLFIYIASISRIKIIYLHLYKINVL